MNKAKPSTVLDFLRIASDYFAEQGIETARLDAEVLLGHVLRKDRVFLYVHFDQPLEPFEVDQYRDLVGRRARREPLAYLTGEKEFYSQTFHVTPAVLIPRPETELLVEAVLAWAMEHPGLTIADVGTGSGAIAVTLARELPDAKLLAIDTSAEALAVAEENAKKLGVADRVRLLRGEWLAPVRGQSLDAVVSNPPYIASADIEQLEPEVRRFEPRLALDGGRDGLDAYRVLLKQAATVVRPDGAMFLEIGHDQAEAVVDLSRLSGWQTEEIISDHAGIQRIVSLRRGAV